MSKNGSLDDPKHENHTQKFEQTSFLHWSEAKFGQSLRLEKLVTVPVFKNVYTILFKYLDETFNE